jgi:Asp-tRNA(Asn)/Glu-tRNA(Gln) amidotransferase A subunit family amidase
LAGNPAISVPMGYVESNLPVGIQLTGKSFAEADLFAAAKKL